MENEITAHRAGKVTELNVTEGAAINAGDQICKIEQGEAVTPTGLPWRGPGSRAARPAAAARQGPAAPRRQLAQALALSGRVLRRAAAVRRAGPGRADRADLLGDLGPRATASCTSARGRSLPRLARGEVWTEGARGRATRGRIDWAPESGGTLVRIEAAAEARRASACAPSCAPARAPGSRRSARPARATTTSGRASAPVAGRAATCGSASAGSATEARGIEDESCGYHPHHTVWDWSAGVGRDHATAARSAGTWSRASTTRRSGSERAIWVDGVAAAEPGAGELRRPRGDRGRRRPRLEFTAEAERRKRGAQLVVALQLPPAVRHLHRHACPGGLELAAGLGVMEHHDAHW